LGDGAPESASRYMVHPDGEIDFPADRVGSQRQAH